MVLGGRPEVPQDRLVALRQQREAADLVLRPRSDVRGRDVADVVHVEAEDGPHLRLGQQVLDPSQAFAAQPIEIDPALPVHRHRAVGFDCHGYAPLSIRLVTYCTTREPLRTPGSRSAPWNLRATAKTESARASRPSGAPARPDSRM